MLDTTQTAITLRGQGSQTSGMRELVEASRPDLMRQVTPLVGEDPFARVHAGAQAFLDVPLSDHATNQREAA